MSGRSPARSPKFATLATRDDVRHGRTERYPHHRQATADDGQVESEGSLQHNENVAHLNQNETRLDVASFRSTAANLS